MQMFLDTFIQTLTNRRQERISTILQEAKVGKEQLAIIADRLVSFQNFAPLLISDEAAGARISGNRMAMNFKDIDVALAELFRVDTDAADLIDGDIAVLSSQIKALEDEISAMEKLTDNYAFLLADGGSYSYAYLEPFNDDLNRDTFDFDIPDRASLAFGSAEMAQVRSNEGVLALAEDLLVSTAMSGTIINSNASAAVITSNNISNAFSSAPDRGWRYVVAAPNPVSSTITEANGADPGAQVYIEFVLATPGPVSEIRIMPFAEHPIDVVRVQLYKDVLADSNGTDVLSEVKTLNNPFTIHFPAQTVAKFRILLSQPTYQRVADTFHGGEDEYRAIWLEYKAKRLPDPRYQFIESLFSNREAFNRLYAFLRVVNYIRQITGNTVYSLPDNVYDAQWGPLRLDAILTSLQRTPGGLEAWLPRKLALDRISRMLGPDERGLVHTMSGSNASATSTQVPLASGSWNDRLGNGSVRRTVQGVSLTTVEDFSDARIPSLLTNVFRNISPWLDRLETNIPLDTIDDVPSLVIAPPYVPPSASFNYSYYLGFQYIGIGLSAPGFKGAFVSKPYDSEGDIGECRIKTVATNYTLNSNRDNNLLTSIEYSVSNVSRPIKETDWIPILPVGTDGIESERFFPDATGAGFFRFTANRSQPIAIYRNGTHMQIDLQHLIFDALNQVVLGVNLPLGETSAIDIFTAAYTPSHDVTVVNFANAGFADLPLVTAHDADGAGEGFLNSGGRNIVDLQHPPYVDENLIQTNLLTKTPTYEPITVVFDNGDIAQNYTNYGTGVQSPLLAPPTAVPMFLHSGRSLIFNDSITQPFRVYYQYLQNNVRTRVVLRVDDKSFASPQVDFIQLKAKIRRSITTGVLQ